MEFIIEVTNFVLVTILIAISVTWLVLIKSMLKSFSKTPYLDKFEVKEHEKPKVSVIIPARNEEKLISKCLNSILDQDYENYEIIVIDDSSEDGTAEILKKYASKNSKIIYVTARPKPKDWMGKNWACMEGFQKATGELLVYTDSDTKYSKNVLSLAVSHMLSLKLDALTVIPKLLCFDNWTRITLPMLSTFLHTRFSALRVNDPSKKTGYFFGSFFIIKKSVYEAIGTHEGVKHEIIEDGALGKKVKEAGYNLRMVRGEHLLEAVWARNKPTLWNGLKRLMIPLFLQGKIIAIGVFVAVLFLLLIPFPILVFSMIFFEYTISFMMLLIFSLVACVLIYVAGFIDATKGLQLRKIYTLFVPVGSFIVVSGFLTGMIQANSRNSVSWRGRRYSMKEHAVSSLEV